MLAFADWIADTWLSLAIRKSVWLIPTIQITHIVAITMIVTAAVMIGARIARLAGRTQTMYETAQRFLPWIWGGLVVLAPTGIILIIAEPQRTLGNATFWWKMAMLLVGIGLTACLPGLAAARPGRMGGSEPKGCSQARVRRFQHPDLARDRRDRTPDRLHVLSCLSCAC